MAASDDLTTLVARLQSKDASAIQLYRANFSSPADIQSMKMWVQRELDRIQAGFSSTDEVVKVLAQVLEALSVTVEEIGEGPAGADGTDGADGQDGEDGADGAVTLYCQSFTPSGAPVGSIWIRN